MSRAAFRIMVLFRCTWCRKYHEKEIPVADPAAVRVVHVVADEYRVCDACRTRLYVKNP